MVGDPSSFRIDDIGREGRVVGFAFFVDPVDVELSEVARGPTPVR